MIPQDADPTALLRWIRVKASTIEPFALVAVAVYTKQCAIPTIVIGAAALVSLDDFVFDPVHYLLLLERKTGALDQAAPLAGWELPEEFGVLRRLLESRMGRRGKREFVQVLRLMENFRKEEVYEAVRDALRLGAISFDAIKHLVLCRIEGRPQRLDLELYPYLPRVTVTKTSASDYMALMSGSGR